MVSIAEIRLWPLNDMPTSDISDEALEQALEAASERIDAIKDPNASSGLVDKALQALAGYYAYLGYLGRPVNDTAGTFVDGYYEPVEGEPGVPVNRSMSDVKAKVKYLKENSDEFLNLITVVDVNPTSSGPVTIPFMGRTYGVSDL